MERGDDRLEIREHQGRESLESGSFVSQTTIYRCTSGEASIVIDGQRCEFIKGTNFIVLDSANISIESCSDDFLYSAIIFGGKTFNRLYTHLDSATLTTLRASAPNIAPLDRYIDSDLTLEKITRLNSSEIEHRRQIMRNLIFCYIYEMHELIEGSATRAKDDLSKYAGSITNRFIILCRTHHREQRCISFYSDALAISRRYLHTLIVKKLHATPKEFIDGYVATSAKRLLLETNKSTEQIAEELGFSDQSTFGQFFKRMTKLSPTTFRNSKR